MDGWAGVILAAGQGVRMKSKIPKVLHRVCGKALIRYPVDIMRQLGIQRVVIVVSPSNAAAIKDLLGEEIEYVIQPQVSGTGDALLRTAELLEGQVGHILVHNGDVPLVRMETARRLVDQHLAESRDMTILTCTATVAQDLGRLIRNKKAQVVDIVEAADWKSSTRLPSEVNGGVYCFSTSWLWDCLRRIEPSPKGEKYITSLVSLGAAQNANIQGIATDDPDELLGVNSRMQLANVEAVQRRRIRERWMAAGVTLLDPASVYIDDDVKIGQDTVLLPNTMLLGRTSVGEDCQIGPSSIIRDSQVGPHCRITASMVEEATLEGDMEMGPFSHLRAGACNERHGHC